MTIKMRTIAGMVQNEIEESFEFERSPFGERWKPLSSLTAAKYMRSQPRNKRRKNDFIIKFGSHGSKKILRDKGDLEGRWHITASHNQAVISNNASARGFPYGLTHQFGSKNGFGRGIFIPARPFLPISKDARLLPRLEKNIIDYLTRTLRG